LYTVYDIVTQLILTINIEMFYDYLIHVSYDTFSYFKNESLGQS